MELRHVIGSVAATGAGTEATIGNQAPLFLLDPLGIGGKIRIRPGAVDEIQYFGNQSRAGGADQMLIAVGDFGQTDELTQKDVKLIRNSINHSYLRFRSAHL